jgi:Bacterial Ig-like domain
MSPRQFSCHLILTRRIPTGTPTTTFNIASNPINSAAQWTQKFPPAGTATVPKVVTVTGGGLNIPTGVNLSNYVIIVESGDLNFNGSSTLNNVMLIANGGNINLNAAQAENVTAVASGALNQNSAARFGGYSVLANGTGNLTFNGATKGITTTDNLRVVSAGNITFNGAQVTRGSFASNGTFTTNGSSEMYGTITAAQNIVFNGNSTFTYANVLDLTDSTAPAINAQLTNDSGSSNSDKITRDGRINGTVTDVSQIVEFKVAFDAQTTYTNVLTSLQNGSFSFTVAQLEQIYGGTIPDGAHTLKLIAQDVSGNQSAVYSLSFTLDTTIVTPSGLQLASASDTGSSNSDKITKLGTPVITGLGTVNDIIQLKEGSMVLGSATVASNGTWSITSSALSNGAHSLTASASDVAGNISSASVPLSLTIDALLPQLTLTQALDTAPLKNNAKLVGSIDGTGSSIASINYRWDNSTTTIPITPSSTGGINQNLDFTGISNGAHILTILATDIAGNVSTNTYNVTVGLDKIAPVITAKLTTDTGSSNTDKITFDPTINGTVLDASQVATFRASFDGTNFANILPQRQTDGSFALTKSQLETIKGRSLAEVHRGSKKPINLIR